MQRKHLPLPLFHILSSALSLIDTLIINSLKLLIKLISSQLYLQPFHYFIENPYATINISNIKSEYLCLNRITDILKTTKLGYSPDNPSNFVQSTDSFSSGSTHQFAFTCYISYTFYDLNTNPCGKAGSINPRLSLR